MNRRRVTLCIAFFAASVLTHSGSFARAQTVSRAIHQIEARLQYKRTRVSNMRVRLLRSAGMQPVAETISRSEGEVRFTNLTVDDYILETFETDIYEATMTNVSVNPIDRGRTVPFTVNVIVDIPLKLSAAPPAAGVVRADVDVNVPKAALKHYREGMKALDDRNSPRALTEFRAAIEAFPSYYAARLELGRELRRGKQLKEAEVVLAPLREIAPKQVEWRVEYGMVLLEQQRREEAARELLEAVRMDEPNWAAHLSLGWALLEDRPEESVPHFERALKIDEQKAARAHIALARIAETKGESARAVAHLDAYLALAPNAQDAEAVRRLANLLRK
jgi:tetratricopeptide (TPR) repeat protein